MICVLAGGVGAARLLDGLKDVVPAEEITAIVNTGDDAIMHGLYICPDIDTVTYTLAGVNNIETGWGLKEETWLAMESLEKLGGKIDFVLHSIGMSPNVRKGKHYTENDYRYYMQTMDVSAISLHKTLATCMKHDALSEWGSVIALSYIAAQRIFPDYNDMADAKSLLESIARSFGYHYGIKKKVRINTISQSPTVTTAGQGIKGFTEFINFSEQMSPLGNAPALACADYCIALFSDLTKYVTMQNLFHDGGFATTGVTQEVIEQFGDE